MAKFRKQTLDALVAVILLAASFVSIPQTGAAPLIDNVKWPIGSKPTIQILISSFFTSNLNPANRTFMLNNITAAINHWNFTYLPVDASIPTGNLTFGQLSQTNLTAGATPVSSTKINVTFADLSAGVLGEANVTVQNGVIAGVVITLDEVEMLTLLPGSFDWANIVAHEIGHGVGLGHDGPPSTLMFKFAEFLFFTSITTSFLPLSKGSINTLQRFYG